MRMYSSAVWLRDDSPGPILSEGILYMSDISLVVGDTNGIRPILIAAVTSGWVSDMTEALTRVERGVNTLHFT